MMYARNVGFAWKPENVLMNDLETKLFNLKQMRSIYYQFGHKPRPKTSPYDEEIEEIEKQLK